VIDNDECIASMRRAPAHPFERPRPTPSSGPDERSRLINQNAPLIDALSMVNCPRWEKLTERVASHKRDRGKKWESSLGWWSD
jgi:hypothetical protein